MNLTTFNKNLEKAEKNLFNKIKALHSSFVQEEESYVTVEDAGLFEIVNMLTEIGCVYSEEDQTIISEEFAMLIHESLENSDVLSAYKKEMKNRRILRDNIIFISKETRNLKQKELTEGLSEDIKNLSKLFNGRTENYVFVSETPLIDLKMPLNKSGVTRIVRRKEDNGVAKRVIQRELALFLIQELMKNDKAGQYIKNARKANTKKENRVSKSKRLEAADIMDLEEEVISDINALLKKMDLSISKENDLVDLNDLTNKYKLNDYNLISQTAMSKMIDNKIMTSKRIFQESKSRIQALISLKVYQEKKEEFLNNH
ncbi:MAG: hypothetical protein CL760_11995 [Chloroflexi bacterium]|nr:hypothetical protein [Chloroflexota bacterium]|tara:strand:- start:35299 stop:36243 length:945 start_codon:yes stop_codon:yes gene_type:complete